MIAEQKYWTDDKVAKFRLKDKNIDLEIDYGEVYQPCEYLISVPFTTKKEAENLEWITTVRIPY